MPQPCALLKGKAITMDTRLIIVLVCIERKFYIFINDKCIVGRSIKLCIGIYIQQTKLYLSGYCLSITTSMLLRRNCKMFAFSLGCYPILIIQFMQIEKNCRINIIFIPKLFNFSTRKIYEANFQNSTNQKLQTDICQIKQIYYEICEVQIVECHQ